MRRMTILIVVVCVLFSVSITIARGVGYRQPSSSPSAVVEQLQMHDCETPCVMGITVGKTSRLEAVMLLAASTLPDYGREVIWNGNSGSIEYRLLDKKSSEVVILYFDFENGKVSAVRVYLRGPTATLTLGNSIQRYGIPLCILAEPDLAMDRVPGMYVAFQINNTIIEMHAEAPPQWDTLIRYMSVYTYDKGQRNLCMCPRKSSWWQAFMPRQLIVPHHIPNSGFLATCPDPN
jgi:hypothetical protein